MSEFYQPGQHPDADQLSAFAEDALPAHEREQTLAHLAGCADCRTIVSLALPPLEDVPQVQPAAERRPWFYGWNVAWLAGAGLAALVFLTVHIRNSEDDRKIAATPTQNAEVRRDAVPQTAAPVAPAVASATPSAVLNTPRAAASTRASDSAETLKTPPKSSTITGEEIANLPLQGRRFIDLAPQQPLTQQQMQQQQAAAVHGSVGGPIAGAAMGAGVARNDRPLPVQSSPRSEVERNLSVTGAVAAPVAAAPVVSAQGQQAPAPPVAAAKAAAQTDNALTMDAAAEMEATNASASIVLLSPGVVNVRILPSHLAVASTITRGNQMLALDTAGALFLSADGGRHWKAVAAPWPGRAVKVELTSLAMAPAKQPASIIIDGINGSANGSIRSSLDPKTPPPPSVIGVIADPSGAIIPGASVRFTDSRTGIVRTTTTDHTGRYAIGALAPDAYQIDASASGFQSWRGAVAVAATQQSVVNIRLTVGAVSDTVEVAAASPIVDDKAAKKALRDAKAAPVSEPSAIFEITTDGGELWTSSDGKNWKRK